MYLYHRMHYERTHNSIRVLIHDYICLRKSFIDTTITFLAQYNNCGINVKLCTLDSMLFNSYIFPTISFAFLRMLYASLCFKVDQTVITWSIREGLTYYVCTFMCKHSCTLCAIIVIIYRTWYVM